jgi:hypothetical protein
MQRGGNPGGSRNSPGAQRSLEETRNFFLFRAKVRYFAKLKRKAGFSVMQISIVDNLF